jgi:hypothetical protein
MTITGVEIHTSSSVAGSLSVSLAKNGVTQVTKTISESPATYAIGGPNSNGIYSWRTIALSSGEYFTVASGDVLDVTMTGVGSSVWKMSADRSGVDYGLGWSSTATFATSSGQNLVGGSWNNTLYYSQSCSSCAFGTSHFRVILKSAATVLAAPARLRIP